MIYSYTVEGKSYQGQRVSFARMIASSYHSRAEKVVNRYLLGSRQKVYYDPRNPAEAILERKVESKVGTLLLIVACFWPAGPPA